MSVTVTKEQINELRTTFLNELDANTNFEIHPSDLDRIKCSDDWLRRFLQHQRCNQKNALGMLWDTVKWRKEHGVNDINESNVRIDYLEEGSIFAHGRDKDGCILFIFKCKKHIKGSKNMDELQRCIIYWFERIEKEEQGKPLSLFFDMEGCGLTNMDMDFIKYLISLLKQYYPYFLNYILIYEMAWILSAAFKIIKSWLPEEAIQKIKFLKKSDIKEFVPLDQALTSWGGNDDYTFTFVPLDPSLNSSSFSNSNKKVHFADGSQMSDTPGTVSDAEHEAGTLAVQPPNVITFGKHGNETCSTIHLHNTDPSTSLSYKMKTTSPEKFRVRPSAGFLEPNGKATITVSLQPGFQLGGLSRDKFLVLSMPVTSTDISAQDLADLWKSAAGKNVIQEHRLKCAPLHEAKNGNAVQVGQAPETPTNQSGEVLGHVKKLSNSVATLESRLSGLKLYLLLFIALLVVVFAVVFAQLQAIKEELKNELAASCYREAHAP